MNLGNIYSWNKHPGTLYILTRTEEIKWVLINLKDGNRWTDQKSLELIKEDIKESFTLVGTIESVNIMPQATAVNYIL